VSEPYFVQLHHQCDLSDWSGYLCFIFCFVLALSNLFNMAMFKLPIQTALPENDKLEHITQPQHAEHLLSNHIGGLAIDK